MDNRGTGRRLSGLGAHHGARGETLIELLVASVVVGLTVVALVSGLATTIRVSASDRERAEAETVLRTFAEGLEALPYETCGGTEAPYASSWPTAVPDGSSGSTVVRASSAAPASSGLVAELVGVRIWDGTRDPAGFTSDCPAPDPGLQELRLRVATASGSIVETATITKRRPCPPGGATCG